MCKRPSDSMKCCQTGTQFFFIQNYKQNGKCNTSLSTGEMSMVPQFQLVIYLIQLFQLVIYFNMICRSVWRVIRVCACMWCVGVCVGVWAHKCNFVWRLCDEGMCWWCVGVCLWRVKFITFKIKCNLFSILGYKLIGFFYGVYFVIIL